jgi:hypothetical protein
VVEFRLDIRGTARPIEDLGTSTGVPDLPRHPGEAQIGIVDPTSAVQDSGSNGLINSGYSHVLYIITVHI